MSTLIDPSTDGGSTYSCQSDDELVVAYLEAHLQAVINGDLGAAPWSIGPRLVRAAAISDTGGWAGAVINDDGTATFPGPVPVSGPSFVIDRQANADIVGICQANEYDLTGGLD